MFHISKADFLALRMNPFYCKHANREIVVWNESCAYEVTILVICMKIFLTTNMFHFEKLFCKMLVLNFTNIEQIRIYLFKAAIKFIQVPFYAYQAAAISFFSVDWILLCCLQNCHFCNYFLLQKQLFDEMMQQPINNYHLYFSLKIINFFYIFLFLFQSTRKSIHPPSYECLTMWNEEYIRIICGLIA